MSSFAKKRTFFRMARRAIVEVQTYAVPLPDPGFLEHAILLGKTLDIRNGSGRQHGWETQVTEPLAGAVLLQNLEQRIPERAHDRIVSEHGEAGSVFGGGRELIVG